MVLLPHQARISANAKLNRAVEHLDTLRREVVDRRQRETHTLTRRDYYDRVPDALVREWIVNVIEPPPLRWSTLVGDFLHNARSALDHLVWGLSGNTPRYPTQVAFPFVLRECDWADASKRRLFDVPEMARATIKGLQPFADSDDEPPELHPLWLLGQLSNTDKHRVLNVVQNFPASFAVELVPPVPGAKVETFGGALEDEAVVARVTVPLRVQSFEVTVNRRMEHTECIDRTEMTPVLPLAQGLTLIGVCVEDAVNAIGTHLPDQSTWESGRPGVGPSRMPPM